MTTGASIRTATRLAYPASVEFAPDEVVLRRLEAPDGPTIVHFARSLPADDLLFLRRDITDPIEVEAWIHTAMSGDTPTILALADRMLIGYVLLAPERAPWARHVAEVRLMIAPQWRGRGLGGLLLSEAVALATEFGYRRLIAQMTFDQAGAYTAFDRFGFVHEATLPARAIDRSGRLRSLRVMGLDTAAFTAPRSDAIEAARATLERTRRWQGDAELLDANGLVIADVVATLYQSAFASRGTRWGGDLTSAASTHLRWSGAEPPTEIRLANGRIGVIGTLGAIRLDVPGSVEAVHVVQMSGLGEPPF